MEAKRIIIYPKDIQRITGKSERYGRSLLNQIKAKLSKEKYQFITISEFCDYAGISAQEVEKFLDN